MGEMGYTRRYAVVVEDAIAVSTWGVSACSEAQRCFLAAAGSAFLFDVKSNEVLETFQLPRATRTQVAQGNGLLVVGSQEGVIRVHQNYKIRDLRIPGAQGVEKISIVGNDTVVVFELDGSVGTVTITLDSLQWRSIYRPFRPDGTASRFYSTFFANSRDQSQEGPLVDCFSYGEDTAVVVRASGMVQMWQVKGSQRRIRSTPVWEWNVSVAGWEHIAPHERRSEVYHEIIGTKATKDGRLCSLIAYARSGLPARLFLVTCGISLSTPVIEMAVEIRNGGQETDAHGTLESVDLVLSANVAYILFTEEGKAAFVSVSKGVSEEDQIYGEVTFVVPRDDSLLCTVDGGGEEIQGGAISIMYKERFTIASAGVPAPTIVTANQKTSMPSARRDASSRVAHSSGASGRAGGESSKERQEGGSVNVGETLYRAYLQYNSGQKGAAKVTLAPIASDFDSRGGSVSASLSAAVASASNRIINSGSQEDDLAPTSLLVNQALSEKHAKHVPLLQMLSDRSMIGTSLWDVMEQSSKSLIVGNAGRLAAAIMVRTVENAHAKDEGLRGTAMIITEALVRAQDDGKDLYQQISRFDRFLPTLQEVFSEVVGSTSDELEEESIDMTSIGEIALVACGGCLAAIKAGLETRNEILVTANIKLEDRGGWPAAERSLGTARLLIDRSLQFSRGCSSILAEALQSSCADLMDILLAALREREGAESPSFVSERSTLLDKLRLFDHGAALSLAEKYLDYALMMEMTCDSEQFNEHFERWSAGLGDEFVTFAFRWLETSGKPSVLLEPRSGVLGRSQARYFTESGRTNLRWLQLIANEDYVGAARTAFKQADEISKNCGVKSLSQTKTLLSFAKLATLAGEEEEDASLADEVDRRLYLIRAQQDVVPSETSILTVSDVVQNFVETKQTANTGSAERVVIALEIIGKGELPIEEVLKLRDFVWQNSIKSEEVAWKSLVDRAKSGAFSDDRLAEETRRTAFYNAAAEVPLSQNEAAAMLNRGVFSGLDLGDEDIVFRLIRTAIDLAGDAAGNEYTSNNDVVMASVEAAH